LKTKFSVALAQIESNPGDKEANLRKFEKAAVRAQKDGAELLILPELSLTGYVV